MLQHYVGSMQQLYEYMRVRQGQKISCKAVVRCWLCYSSDCLHLFETKTASDSAHVEIYINLDYNLMLCSDFIMSL